MKQDRLLVDFLAHLGRLFSVTLSDARRIVVHFHDEMRRGLAGKKSSLKMIPSFVGRPSGKERGSFLALDLGGTNVRVLAVALDGRGGVEAEAVSRFVVPPEIMRGEGDALFDFLAGCIGSFFEESRLPRRQRYDLAFTFSFPVAQSSIASGKLLTWTKGFTAAGVVDEDVVALLSAAIRRKNLDGVRVTALVNDTVGALTAKSYADPSCDMGVILGTGTNACYPERTDRITKRPDFGPAREMIINMEWGGFDRLAMSKYDRTLDRSSFNPGRQRMEKMVSGMYLGELVRLLILEAIDRGFLFKKRDRPAFADAYSLTSENLARTVQGDDILSDSALRDASDRDRRAVAEICRLVSTRAARIAGAAISAVVTWMDPALAVRHTVAVDGSLFEKYPGFRENLLEVFRELLGGRASRIALAPSVDGSGIGAAILAATASSVRDRR